MPLGDFLNKPIDPFSSVGTVAAGADVQARGSLAAKEIEPLLRGESEARREAARLEAEDKRKQAMAETEAVTQEAIGARRATEEFQKKLTGALQFNPTQFDSVEAGKLAGLTAVIGAVVGKNSARAALRSMAGFTQGAREGRADLYDREVKQFQRDVDTWKNNLLIGEKELIKVIDLLGKNRTAAMTKAKELGPLLQEGTALAKVRVNDFTGALQDIRAAKKVGDDLTVAIEKTTAKGAGGKIRMTTEPEKRLSGARESLESVINLEQRLRDPKVAKVLEDTRFVRTLLESPKEMFPIEKYIRSTLYQSLPKEAQELFLQIAQARNDYYRQLSGQAVTGSEAARNFFATIQPTDTAETLLIKINGLKPKFIRQLQDIESDYEIGPGTQQRISELLNQARGGNALSSPAVATPAATDQRKSFATEQEADEAFANRKIKDGEKITIGGKNATYRANQ